MTAATPSTKHRDAVLASIKGRSLGPLSFLKNFKGAHDAAETTSASSKSTKLFLDTRTLAGSATDSLKLSALTDANGAAVVFTKVHAIYVRPASTNGNKVQVGGAATNTFVGPFADPSDAVLVGAGQEFLETSANGWTVTANTGDILKVLNTDAAAASYDIVIMGE